MQKQVRILYKNRTDCSIFGPYAYNHQARDIIKTAMARPHVLTAVIEDYIPPKGAKPNEL